jgi:hypothetical protein
MGYPVFYGYASVFFVGGNGDKSGRTALAGGCTRDWWDGQCPNGTDAEKAAAMGKLMVDGAPVIDETNCAYSAAMHRITKAGCFAGAEAGMAAYVVETPTPGVRLETMRYRITDVDAAGDWIAIGDATGADATVTVKVGGAFDALQNALDETDAGSHSVCIFTNLSETLGGPIDVDAGGGDVMRNTFKRIVGYHTVPGDMDRGGAWCESPLDILRNGAIDADRCVVLDGSGGGFAALVFNGVDNVVLENLALRDTGGQNAISFSTVCRNIVFGNCRFTGVHIVINTEAEHVLFDRCYSHDDITGHHYNLRGNNNMLLGCVGRMATGTNLCNVLSKAGNVIGCIAVGGQFGVRVVNAGGYATVLNNTFFGTEVDGVLFDAGDGAMVVNNIFCLSPGAVGVYVRGGGSVVVSDYNCFIASDGAPLTATGNGYAGGELPIEGPHSLEADPEFANAGSYDLRPRSAAVLRGGRPGPDGTATVIGAIGQAYRFDRRARMVNAGRMGILR